MSKIMGGDGSNFIGDMAKDATQQRPPRRRVPTTIVPEERQIGCLMQLYTAAMGVFFVAALIFGRD